jgi:DNA-binding response OmpR family regulator
MPWENPVERRAMSLRQPPLAFARDSTSGSRTRPAKGKSILIVEDDYLISMQVEAALTDAGFDVVGIAPSGEEAIESVTLRKPSLVVMDVRLAGARDGIDVALELFREHGIRCIFATAHYDQRARMRAEPAGPLGWLQKPYTMASLVEMVRQALNDSDEA